MTEIHYPNPSPEHQEHAAVRHETSDISFRGVMTFLASLFVAAVFIHFVIWVLAVYFDARESTKTARQFPLSIGQENRLPPEPRLQTNPREDLRVLRANEDAALNGYGWVDRNNGVVHIPIGEAMKLTLQRGLPVRQGAHDQH